jgi:hypothetical protein
MTKISKQFLCVYISMFYVSTKLFQEKNDLSGLKTDKFGTKISFFATGFLYFFCRRHKKISDFYKTLREHVECEGIHG